MYAYCNKNPVNDSAPTGYWAEKMAGFYWRKGEKAFTVKTSRAFLSRSFCLAFAKDIIKMKGTKKHWYSTKKFAGLTAKEIAAECYAHAVGYYFSKLTVRYFGKGVSTNNQGKEIDIDANDWRKWQFNMV